MAKAMYPWHAQPWQRFAEALARGQVAHALLIHGEGGLHKVQLARAIGRSLLCKDRDSQAHACGRCRSCVLALAGNHPDWVQVTLEDSAIIKIDQIRQLSERLAMRPQIAEHQVAMLWPAERMNSAAANALLKTLEEPAGDTHLLLVADRSGRLPATIRSRCQRIPVVAGIDAGSVAGLAELAGVDTERAQLALAISLGDPEAAQAMLEPKVWSEWLALMACLVEIAAGRSTPFSLVSAYPRDGARMLERWSRLIGFAVRGDVVSGGEWSRWVSLTSRAEMLRLLPFATQLERARALLGSGVREDLMVGDLARRWSDLFVGERRRGA